MLQTFIETRWNTALKSFLEEEKKKLSVHDEINQLLAQDNLEWSLVKKRTND